MKFLVGAMSAPPLRAGITATAILTLIGKEADLPPDPNKVFGVGVNIL
jgi:hypothetical protein